MLISAVLFLSDLYSFLFFFLSSYISGSFSTVCNRVLRENILTLLPVLGEGVQSLTKKYVSCGCFVDILYQVKETILYS